jgi:hypothetical protein
MFMLVLAESPISCNFLATVIVVTRKHNRLASLLCSYREHSEKILNLLQSTTFCFHKMSKIPNTSLPER